MCGRFLAGRPDPGTPIGAELAAWEASYDGPPMKTRGEVFPTDMAPIVTYEGALKARAMVWGFPGFSFKSGARPRPLINARAETAATLKTWRSALSSRRCLVPAAGFYEWSHKGGKKSSLKLLFTLPDSDHLLMAGLWGEFDGSWPWR
ncbi:MAG: SOS response-associated peptidase, partial [Deltaproteobacteria bacterium]|nr:SOS response-associated peptidase [Deltaproteobacteria bacterium]